MPVSTLRKQKDEERKLRTAEMLLDAAQKVFTGSGYHQALISDIVAEAEVGQGTFYRHFESKRDILDAILDRYIQNIMAEFNSMTANLPQNHEEYRAASINAIKSVAATIEANREITLFILREASSVDDRFSQKMEIIYDNFAALAGFYLQHAIAGGFARPCRVPIVSQMLVGLGKRAMELWFGERITDIDRDEMIEEIVDLAFFGFGNNG